MMRLVCTVAIAGVLAACGSSINQDACKAYVDHLNGLSCRSDQAAVRAATTCPDNFDGSGNITCSEYFDCLTTAARCEGDAFVNTAEQDCTACTNPDDK